jgi:hypothetical protein
VFLACVACVIVLGADVASVSAQTTTCFGRSPTLIGTEGPDELRGTNADDVIVGLGGEDVIVGFDGDDRLCGGNGVDIIAGARGDDRVDGGADMDAIGGEEGNDELRGGAGLDVVSFQVRVRVDLARGTATGEGSDRLSGIEALHGSPFGDELLGDEQINIFFPADGDDVIRGRDGFDAVAFMRPVEADLAARRSVGEGTDTLLEVEGLASVAEGRDVLRGDAGANVLIGGPGNDTLIGRAGNDDMLGGPGQDEFQGDAGADLLEGTLDGDVWDGGGGRNDTISFLNLGGGVRLTLDGQGLIGVENVLGSQFHDEIFGTAVANSLWGNGGDDFIDAGAGDDFLSGGVGADTLDAGEGVDYCVEGENVAECETTQGGAARFAAIPSAVSAPERRTSSSAAVTPSRSTRSSPSVIPSSPRTAFGASTHRRDALGAEATVTVLRRMAACASALACPVTRMRAARPATARRVDADPPRQELFAASPPHAECGRSGTRAFTSIAPPREIVLVAQGDVLQTVRWRGELKRLSNGRASVVYRTPLARATVAGARVLHPGVAKWVMPSGRSYRPVPRQRLSKPGRYQWSVMISWEAPRSAGAAPGSPPHYSAAGRPGPWCEVGR